MSIKVEPVNSVRASDVDEKVQDSVDLEEEVSRVKYLGIDEDDPNLDTNAIGDVETDSPYPEVRSAVANTDDVDMPCSTIRAWVIGIGMSILIPGLDEYVCQPFQETWC